MLTIPNLLTLTNLFLGCLSIVCAFNQQLEVIPYLVFGAAIADFLDGFVARLLKSTSPIGMQLDSLADMVTFGVVPGVVLFQLLHLAYFGTYTNGTIGWEDILYLCPAFLVILFSALRLAKFNVDTRQTIEFIGLATPASTLLVIGLLLSVQSNQLELNTLFLSTYFLYGLIGVLSYLLVAEIPMFSGKVKQWGWKGNEWRYSFVLIALTLIIGLQGLGLLLSIIVYIVFSFVKMRIDERCLINN